MESSGDCYQQTELEIDLIQSRDRIYMETAGRMAGLMYNFVPGLPAS